MSFFPINMTSPDRDQNLDETTYVDRLGREFVVENQEDDRLVLRFIASQISVVQTAKYFSEQLYTKVPSSHDTPEEEIAA